MEFDITERRFSSVSKSCPVGKKPTHLTFSKVLSMSYAKRNKKYILLHDLLSVRVYNIETVSPNVGWLSTCELQIRCFLEIFIMAYLH